MQKNKSLMAIAALVGLASCSPTLYQSQKQLNKVEHYHPELIAAYCAKEYPVKADTVTLPPVTIRRVDTVPGPVMYVDCDSATRYMPGAAVVAVNCPPSIRVHDSVFIPQVITVENVAKAAALESQVRTVTEERAKTSGQLSTWRGVAFVFIGLFILACIGVGLLLKRKTTI